MRPLVWPSPYTIRPINKLSVDRIWHLILRADKEEKASGGTHPVSLRQRVAACHRGELVQTAEPRHHATVRDQRPERGRGVCRPVPDDG